MNSEDFLNEILAPVHEFCRFLDANPPAYCYVPLRTDEERMIARYTIQTLAMEDAVVPRHTMAVARPAPKSGETA